MSERLTVDPRNPKRFVRPATARFLIDYPPKAANIGRSMLDLHAREGSSCNEFIKAGYGLVAGITNRPATLEAASRAREDPRLNGRKFRMAGNISRLLVATGTSTFDVVVLDDAFGGLTESVRQQKVTSAMAHTKPAGANILSIPIKSAENRMNGGWQPDYASRIELEKMYTRAGWGIEVNDIIVAPMLNDMPPVEFNVLIARKAA